MSLALELTRDEISPALARLAGADLQRRAIMAAGTVIVGITQRAFDDPGLRPAPWAPRKKIGDGHPLLKRTNPTLWPSINAQLVGHDAVKIGSPVIYGPIQQLGSRKTSGRGSGVPPRPFFPVTADGQLTQLAMDRVGKAIDIVVRGVA